MFNHADCEFTIKAGDRIAQLVCERIAYPEIQVISWSGLSPSCPPVPGAGQPGLHSQRRGGLWVYWD